MEMYLTEATDKFLTAESKGHTSVPFLLNSHRRKTWKITIFPSFLLTELHFYFASPQRWAMIDLSQFGNLNHFANDHL